jgi:hypothetical protein
MSAAEAEVQQRADTGRGWLGGLFRRPPGRVFHGLLLIPCFALLVAASVPGLDFFLFVGAGWVLVGFILVWMVRVVTVLVAHRQDRATGAWWRVAVAPAVGVVVLVLLTFNVPLDVRWAMSEDAFNEAVEDINQDRPDRDPSDSIGAPTTIGSYNVRYARRVEDGGVLFFDADGGLIDEVGFAYLPNGPYPELENGIFERPHFESLGGGWYTFSASW